MLQDFKKFLLQGDLIMVAVAFVIGLKVTEIVNSIVENLITPLIGMIAGKDFSELTFTINDSIFRYGNVINAVIAFVSVAAVIFFLIVRPYDAWKARRAAGGDADVPPTQEELLTEIRDLLAARQP